MANEPLRPRWGIRRPLRRELSRLEPEIDDLFSRFFRGWLWPRGDVEALGWTPAVDVVDHKNELVLRADLPGMSEKDIDISLEEGNLTIRGKREEEREQKEADYRCCERWSGFFSRSLMLPPGVDTEKISATFKNGVLEVHLPKAKAAVGKKIEIKAA